MHRRGHNDKTKNKRCIESNFDSSNKMSNKQGKIRDKNKEIRHNYIMRIVTSEKWMSEKLDAPEMTAQIRFSIENIS